MMICSSAQEALCLHASRGFMEGYNDRRQTCFKKHGFIGASNATCNHSANHNRRSHVSMAAFLNSSVSSPTRLGKRHRRPPHCFTVHTTTYGPTHPTTLPPTSGRESIKP
ncbi:unnamed protein product [Cuscuta campestris]|uniref:Uncharacterized protein n=1 Tax=Cuscuta campestris TaxID=132261 RepID=A0A484MNJ5_9ASTE|nr:unnamed protein product [Cuscuta campestris]